MGGRISYDRDTRKKALIDQKGLVTIQVIAPGEQAGKRGIAISVQSLADKADCKAVTRFLFRFLNTQAKKHRGKDEPERG